jgi:iron complex outermembrane receptor protein
MRKQIAILTLTILCVSAISAQKVTGVVKDPDGKGLDKTTVSLLRANDSSVVKLSVTDKSGKFTIESTPGKYLVSTSHVGYLPQFSQVFDLSTDQTLADFTLVKSEGALEGVVVSSKKPMIEVKADKMIVNV